MQVSTILCSGSS